MPDFRYIAATDFEVTFNRSEKLISLPITQFHPTRRTTTDEISPELNVPYTVFEILVAICAIIGNLMVIIVFQRERKLRRRTNYYIISLAIADFLVGSLGVPFAILASVGLPTNLHACLFTVSLLVVLCTISIFCLVAVSVDRYWAILYPMAYSRNVRTRTAIVIISMCWLAGTVVGFLPLFGWHAAVDDNQACLFVEVMDYNYLVFLYFATIITPALLMLAFYAHIYKVIIKQVRQIVTMNPMADTSRRSSTSAIQTNSTSNSRSCHGGTMLRVLGAARKRDVKATQNLSIIVLFFMVCWIPLYTINCVQAFCPTCSIHPKLTLFCIILSHLNSAVNPILYAYHLKDFRLALKNLILKVMGIEIETTLDAQYRYSMASQHRLQSMDVSARNNVQTRIYVDSPVWLRQQQQLSLKSPQTLPKCGVVQPCLNNIHQTVSAVASVTTDIEKEMWKIAEANSNHAEIGEINYVFPSDKDSAAPTPPPRHRRKSRQKSGSCDSPYSYDNCTFTPSPDGDDFEEVFLPARSTENGGGGMGNCAGGGGGIDHKLLNQTLIACAMRDKILSDRDDRPPSSPLSQSDYELPKRDTEVSNTPNHYSNSSKVKSLTNTPPPTPKQMELMKLKKTTRSSLPLTSSNGCLSSNSIYIIDTDSNPVSPGRKPKYRKTANLTKSLTRSCSCTSDTSGSPSPERERKHSEHCSVSSYSSRSSSSISLNKLDSTSQGNFPEGPHNNNSLNYYTFHHTSSHHSHQLPHNQRLQSPAQQSSHHQEKFSPLKAMTNFIFPPIVKHSSLFQLFHPASSSSTTTVENSSCTAATISKSSMHFPTTDSNSVRKIGKSPSTGVETTESITTTTTDLVDDSNASSLEVPKVAQIRTDS